MVRNRKDELKYQSIALAVMILSSCLLWRNASELSNEVIAYALPDYSMGYSSRMLVGSILKLFKSTFTIKWLHSFYVVVDVAAIAMTTLYLRGFVSKAEKADRLPRLALVLFFASFPYAIPYFANILGLPDVYWYIFSLIAIMLIDVKGFRWAIPLLTVLCVAVHPAYALAFFPPVVILLLYRSVTSEKCKGSYAAVLILAFVLTAAASVYSVFFEKNFLKMTLHQAYEYMNSKINVGSTGIEFYLFGDMVSKPDGFENVSVANDFFSTIKTIRVFVRNSRGFSGIVMTALRFIPAFAAIDYIWIKAWRATDNKKEKLVYFLCVIFQAGMLFTWFASTDLARWAANCLIPEIIMLIWMLRKENTYVTNAYMSIIESAKKNPIVLSAAVMLSYLIL